MITLRENIYRSVKPSEAKDLDNRNNPRLLFALKKNEVVLVESVASGKVTAIAGDGGTAGLSFRNTQSFHNRRDTNRSVWLDSHMWLDTDIPFDGFLPGCYLVGATFIPRFEWLVHCLEKGEDFIEVNTATVERLDLYKCYILAAGTRLPTGYVMIEDDTPAGHRTLTFQGKKLLAVSKVKKRTMYVAEEMVESVSASDHCVLIRASGRPATSTTAPMAAFNLLHNTSTHTPSNTTIDTTSSTTSNTTTCATPSSKHNPAVLALAGAFWDVLPECDVDVDEALFSWLSSAKVSNYNLESAKPLFNGQLAGMVYEAVAHLSFDALELLDHVKQMLVKAEESKLEEEMLSKPEQQEDPPESNQTFEKAKEVGAKLSNEDKAMYQNIAAAHLEKSDIPAVIKAYGGAQMEAHDQAIEKNMTNLELDLKKQEKRIINDKGICAKVEKLPGQNTDDTDVETVGTLSAGSSLPGSGNKVTRAQSMDSDSGQMLPAVNLFVSGIQTTTAPTTAPTAAPSARSPIHRKSHSSSFKSYTPTTLPDTPGKEQRKQMQRTSKAEESAVQARAPHAGEQPKVKNLSEN